MEDGRQSVTAELCHSLILPLFCLSTSPSGSLQSLRDNLLQYVLFLRLQCPSGHIHLLQYGLQYCLFCGLQEKLCFCAWSTTAPSLTLLFMLLFLTYSPSLCSLCGVFAHCEICLHRGAPSLAEELS